MKFNAFYVLIEENIDPRESGNPLKTRMNLTLNLPLSGCYWQFHAGCCISLHFEKLLGKVNKPFIHRYMPDSKVVGWQGLEPWTNALKGHCSTN